MKKSGQAVRLMAMEQMKKSEQAVRSMAMELMKKSGQAVRSKVDKACEEADDQPT